MAYTYDVSERRQGRTIQFSGTSDKLSIVWNNEYQVIVGTTTSDDPADVSPYDVVTASGLPVVNSSIYYFSSKVIPFAICRDKRATQNPDKLSQWTVKATYKSFDNSQTESGLAPVTPPAAIASLGTSEQASLGEMELVLYEDKSTTPKKILLPSGAFFAEPVVERIPVLTIKLTQYESSITYNQMLDRKFKVNDATYRTQAARKWLIEHVEASTVSVQLAAGATTAALVTYTLVLSPLDEGWDKTLALVDYVHNTGTAMAPAWEPYLDDSEPPQQKLVYVDSDGIKKVSQSVPDYEQYQVYDDTTFSSFLLA